ncbi:MAG: hypothetical protein ACRDA3_03965 [Peptostreptococcaceae bacterium]
MKNHFENIVQKCICIDFLLNALINSNSYQYLNFLNSVKEENLKNIKIICHLYEYLFDKQLVLDNTPSIRLNKCYDNRLDMLLEYNLNIITDLEFLKHSSLKQNHFPLLQNLINSYFNFISLINCLYSDHSADYSHDSFNENTIFFNLINSFVFDVSESPPSIDLIRSICIEAIELFFGYSLSNNEIDDEYYEIFFKNSPENKFYQYYFKSLDKIYKIRIFDKDCKVFYIYSYNPTFIDILDSSFNKDSAKELVDSYLKKKLHSKFYTLSFDNSYSNISYYMKSVESYKFKYNYNTNNSLYVTVDAKSMSVQEISLF